MATLTRVDYWFDKETPDNTGWYICHYGTVDDMLAKSPEDVIGPYDTESEAKRVLAETTDLDDEENKPTAKRKPYDPASDPAPTLDAGIPTDNDDGDDFERSEGEANAGKSVQLELQQAQELRDVPPKISGD